MTAGYSPLATQGVPSLAKTLGSDSSQKTGFADRNDSHPLKRRDEPRFTFNRDPVARGCTARQIGQLIGLSESTVRNWWAGATCPCGRYIDRSNPRTRRCFDCRKAFEHAGRVWTREAIIDAIRRFAALHGRPPVSSEWINADPVNGYPPRSAVYRTRSRSGKHQPFAAWADAIEAAGFRRPHPGSRRFDPQPVSPSGRAEA